MRRFSSLLTSTGLTFFFLASFSLLGPLRATEFVRGDANTDGAVDLSDAIAILWHLFIGGEPLVCADAADANDDEALDISDPIYTLEFLFLEGEAPPPPYPDPGMDPGEDGLYCDADGSPPSISDLRPAPGDFLGEVRPSISASFADDVSGVDVGSVRIALDGADWTGAAAIGEAGFSLVPTADLVEGSHQVRVEIADRLGHAAPPAEWTFTIDLTKPTCLLDPVASPTNVAQVVVAGSYIESHTESIEVNGLPAQIDPSSRRFSLPLQLAEGRNEISTAVLDRAGNAGSCRAEVDLDTVAPLGTIRFAGGESLTNRTVLDLSLAATDSGTGVSRMQFSNDGVAWSDAEPFAPEKKDWRLSPGDGEKRVQARFGDPAGNWSSAAEATILLDATPPAVAALAPATGAIISDPRPTLSATFQDAASGIDGSSIWVALDGVDVTGASTVADDGFSFTCEEPLSQGRHEIGLHVRDIAGNEAPVGRWSFVVLIDPQPSLLGSVWLTWGTPCDGALQHVGGRTFIYVVLDESYTPLVCFDVTDPERPVFVGGFETMAGWVLDVAVHENLVYVPGTGGNVDILDASDPYRLTRLTTWNIGRQNRVKGIDVVRIGPGIRHAYVEYNYGAFEVWDLSDLMAPALLGRFAHEDRTGGWHVRAHPDQKVVYVCNGTLNVYDVIDAQAPQLLLQIQEPGGFDKLAFSPDGKVLFACTGLGLTSLDIAAPEAPRVLGRLTPHAEEPYEVPYGGICLTADGQHVLLAGRGGFWPGYEWKEIEPGEPVPEGYEVRDIDRGGEIVVARFIPPHGTQKGGLHVIDVSDPENPFEVGHYRHPHDRIGFVWVDALGDIAYVVDQKYGIRTFDLGDLQQPVFLGGGHCSGEVDDVHVSGNFAYLVQNLGGGMAVVDIADKGNPILRSFHPTGLQEWDVTAYDRYVYLSSGDEGYAFGLEVVDVSNPDAPTFVVRLPFEPWGDVVIEGSCAYTSFGHIYTLEDPSHPRLTGRILAEDFWASAFISVAKCGPHVYLSYTVEAKEHNFAIADVSDVWGLAPKVIGSLSVPGTGWWSQSIAVDFDRPFEKVYLALGGTGLGVVDVSDPTAPRFDGSITHDRDGHPLGDVVNAWVARGQLYVSNYYGSLSQYDLREGADRLKLVASVPNTQPVWTARIKDGYGYKAKLTGLDVVRLPDSFQIDFTPPADVNGLESAWEGMKVALTWQDPQDPDWLATKIVRRTDRFPASVSDGRLVYDGRGGAFADTHLDAAMTYYYAAFTYDGAQNYSSAATACTSVYVDDPFPPAPVKDFYTVAMDGEALLVWVNPPDEDWAGTVVVRKLDDFPRSPLDGEVVYDGKGNRALDTGLINGETYRYGAFAYDEVPNYSAALEGSQDIALPQPNLFSDDFEGEVLLQVPSRWSAVLTAPQNLLVHDDDNPSSFGACLPLGSKVMGSWGNGPHPSLANYIDDPAGITFDEFTIHFDVLDCDFGGRNVEVCSIYFGYVDDGNHFRLDIMPFVHSVGFHGYTGGVDVLATDFPLSLAPGTGDRWFHVRLSIGRQELVLHVNGSLAIHIQGDQVTYRYMAVEDRYYTGQISSPFEARPGRVGLSGWFGFYIDNVIVTRR